MKEEAEAKQSCCGFFFNSIVWYKKTKSTENKLQEYYIWKLFLNSKNIYVTLHDNSGIYHLGERRMRRILYTVTNESNEGLDKIIANDIVTICTFYM